MLSLDNLSVQLYTLRERLVADPDRTLADVAQTGLVNVEPFGLVDFADVLTANLAKNGLSAPTAHVELFDEDLGPVFDAAARVGVRTIIQPVSEPALWDSVDGIAQVVDRLNRAAEQARPYDLRVGYHNHWFEVEALFDGRTGLEVLASQLSDEVNLEVDTYWAYVGAADVPKLLDSLGDRVRALHLKDGDGTRNMKAQTSVGKGSVPVLDFVAACPSMEYGVIELDDATIDPTQAVRESVDYLNGK